MCEMPCPPLRSDILIGDGESIAAVQRNEGRRLNKSFWLKMVAKLLVIISLPLAIVTYSSEIGYNWFYSSSLFLLQGSSYPVPPPYPGFTTPDARVILSALVLSCPGILFSYLLHSQPGEKTTLGLLLLTTLFTLVLASMLILLIPLMPVDPWLYYPNSVEFMTSWILVLMVFMPFFTMEGSRLAIDWSREAIFPRPDRGTSTKPLPSKGSVIGFIVGVSSLLLPFSLDFLTFEPVGTYMDIRGPFWAGTLGFLSEFELDFTRFSLYPVPISFNPLTQTQFFANLTTMLIPRSFFGILFGYSVLRHLQSKMTEKRTLLLAGLSIMAPLLTFIMQPFLFPGYLPQYSRFYIPVPLLQVFGLFIMYRARLVPTDEYFQDDTESRMESDQEQTMLHTTPDSARVSIPASYRIRSKLQWFRGEEKDSNEESNMQPTDRD
jgi:hypothetical protein